MGRPTLEVADIFRAHGPAWRQQQAGHLSLGQLKVMSAIEQCRTAALGGHALRCDDCGHEELNMDVCPVCGSKNLTKIDRMNGYLSYSRVKGDTRLNDAKMAEIAERKSM